MTKTNSKNALMVDGRPVNGLQAIQDQRDAQNYKRPSLHPPRVKNITKQFALPKKSKRK